MTNAVLPQGTLGARKMRCCRKGKALQEKMRCCRKGSALQEKMRCCRKNMFRHLIAFRNGRNDFETKNKKNFQNDKNDKK